MLQIENAQCDAGQKRAYQQARRTKYRDAAKRTHQHEEGRDGCTATYDRGPQEIVHDRTDDVPDIARPTAGSTCPINSR